MNDFQVLPSAIVSTELAASAAEPTLFPLPAISDDSPLAEVLRMWMSEDRALGTRFIDFYSRCGLSSRSSSLALGFSEAIADLTSPLLQRVLPASYLTFLIEAGNTPEPSLGDRDLTTSPGACLTFNISECLSDVKSSTLSQVLSADCAEKYLLTPRASAGVLARIVHRKSDVRVKDQLLVQAAPFLSSGVVPASTSRRSKKARSRRQSTVTTSRSGKKGKATGNQATGNQATGSQAAGNRRSAKQLPEKSSSSSATPSIGLFADP